MITRDSLVITPARPVARPRPLSSGAIGATSPLFGDPAAPRVFDGIDGWPDWSQALRDLKLDDGMLDPSGRLGFSAPSRAALEIPANVAEHAGRFRYRDQAEIEWAVLVTGDKPEAWDGLAIGCGREVAILTHRRRTDLIRRMTQSLESLAQPGEALDEPGLHERTKFAHARRWLAGLDAAVAALPSIYLGAICARPNPVRMYAQTLAEAAWGAHALSWPEDWRMFIFEALAMLGAIEMQRVRFRKSGRRPKSLARQPAGLGLCWVDSETIELHWSQLFVEFLGEWLAPGKPASNYAQRHGTYLGRIPLTKDWE